MRSRLVPLCASRIHFNFQISEADTVRLDGPVVTDDVHNRRRLLLCQKEQQKGAMEVCGDPGRLRLREEHLPRKSSP